MGLDIYFEKCKKLREYEPSKETLVEYYEELYHDHTKKMHALAIDTIKEYQGKIAKAKSTEFFKLRNELNEKLSKFYEYDFDYKPWTTAKTKTSFKTDIKNFLEKDKEMVEKYKDSDNLFFFPPYAAYFRKVNFIYRYFQPKLEHEMCIVTKDDINDILTKAKVVLEKRETKVSKSLLPTQEGFFFGDTTYSQYYYEDVEDVIKKFEAVLKDWKDDEILFVTMSW